MSFELPDALLCRTDPARVKRYAADLGWKLVDGVKRAVIVMNHPSDDLTQLQIPTKGSDRDVAFLMRDAIEKLAEFENRPANEVLEHLLLPPSDLLRFREVGPDAEPGPVPLDRAVRLVNGARRLLLSAAQSVVAPGPYHPRQGPSEAEEFVDRCRVGLDDPSDFALSVVCPLGLQPSLPNGEGEPFVRQATKLLMQSLDALARAGDASSMVDLADWQRYPGLSANFCESLLMLRPAEERDSVSVSASWSRAFPPPETANVVQVGKTAFEAAEALAASLRTPPQIHARRFIGFVAALLGKRAEHGNPHSGEVEFTLLDNEEGELRARGVLNAEDYAIAGEAHLNSRVVTFKATLRRLARVNRVDSITGFGRVSFDEDAPIALAEATT